MLMSTQQGSKGLLSNLPVWTACFGRDQQLQQHHHGAGRALTHRGHTGNIYISL